MPQRRRKKVATARAQAKRKIAKVRATKKKRTRKLPVEGRKNLLRPVGRQRGKITLFLFLRSNNINHYLLIRRIVLISLCRAARKSPDVVSPRRSKRQPPVTKSVTLPSSQSKLEELEKDASKKIKTNVFFR